MPIFNQTWTAYPLPNATGMVEMFKYANTATGEMFSMLLPFTIFLVAFMVIRRHEDVSDSFLVSAFISFSLSSFLKILNLTADWVVLLWGLGVGISFLISAKDWIK